MIRIFTAGREGERWILLADVTVITQEIDSVFGTPYIFFEHKDYPLGALKAEFTGEHWSCNLD